MGIEAPLHESAQLLGYALVNLASNVTRQVNGLSADQLASLPRPPNNGSLEQ